MDMCVARLGKEFVAVLFYIKKGYQFCVEHQDNKRANEPSLACTVLWGKILTLFLLNPKSNIG